MVKLTPARTTPAMPRAQRTPWQWLNREGPLGYLLISPSLLFLLFMLAYPFVIAIVLSLSEKRLGGPMTFVGFENFVKLFATNRFWLTVQNSLVYTAGALILKFGGGLALAQLLNREFIGKRIATALVLLPWIIPTAFSTLAWWWMLDPANSIINIMLKRWGLITNNLPFLVDGTWAMSTLIFLNVWRGVPFFSITFLAALQTVPEELLEAAKIDGANAWQRFWRITFPLIIPVVIIVVLISTISTLGDFEVPYLLTKGGPRDATMIFGLLSYEYALGIGALGIGSAVSLTMLPFLAILVVFALLEVRRNN
ncbi:MAG: sugar ABC transporter permease [Caldilineaceae bacterium]|nr:sugar ABC transporter permease [Caldilineaceae bacterium]